MNDIKNEEDEKVVELNEIEKDDLFLNKEIIISNILLYFFLYLH